MIFLTQDDILELIKQDALDVVSEANPAKIDGAELTAIDEMYGYLNVRYDAEAIFSATGTDRNKAIVNACVNFTLYHLHAGISPDNIPTLRMDRYKESVEFLDKTADGFIVPNLPAKEDSPETPLRWGSSLPKTDQHY